MPRICYHCRFLLCLAYSVALFLPLSALSQAEQEEQPQVEASPSPAAYLPSTLEKATRALEKQEFDRVLILAKKSLTKSEERYFDKAYELLGKAQYHKHLYDEAFSSLKNSLRYRARNSDVLHYVGLIYRERRDQEQALRTFKEAIWFGDYGSVSAGASYAQLSSIYLEKGEPDKAKEYLQYAQKQSPTDSSSARSLARYYVGDGMYVEAVQLLAPFLKNKEIDPQEKVNITLESARFMLTAPHGTFDKAAVQSTRNELRNLSAKSGTVLTSDDEEEPLQESDLSEDAEVVEVTINEYEREKLLALSSLQLADIPSAQESIAKAKSLRSNAESDEELRLIERQLEIAKSADVDYSSDDESEN